MDTSSSTSTPTAPRFDPYRGIHKALRALMTDTLLALGSVDCDEPSELRATLKRVAILLDVCRAHARHENTFMHPALEACAPGASQSTEDDHALHDQAIDRMQEVAQGLEQLPAAQRHAQALELYRSLALFVAHSFEHMHHEETAHTATLWARYSDAEIGVFHDALTAAVPPEEQMRILRWMLPSLNPAERAGLLRALRAKAPAPAFGAVMAMTRIHLDARSHAKLMTALEAAQPEPAEA